ECRALSHPALGGQYDDECGQRQWVQCDRQADQEKIKHHVHPSRLVSAKGVPMLAIPWSRAQRTGDGLSSAPCLLVTAACRAMLFTTFRVITGLGFPPRSWRVC